MQASRRVKSRNFICYHSERREAGLSCAIDWVGPAEHAPGAHNSQAKFNAEVCAQTSWQIEPPVNAQRMALHADWQLSGAPSKLHRNHILPPVILEEGS